MKSYSLEGIVIKRSNFGEANKLVTLFTNTHGKVTLVAKGLRKLSSKRAGPLELFNHVKLHAVHGRGELDILTEVQLINSFPAWRKQLGRVTLAYQLAEVVDKLTPDSQSHPEIFALLLHSFSQISRLNSNWKLNLESWILNILVELGFWPKDQNFTGNITKLVEEISDR